MAAACPIGRGRAFPRSCYAEPGIGLQNIISNPQKSTFPGNPGRARADCRGEGMQSSPAEERLVIDRFLAGDPEAIHTVDRWIDAVLREDFQSLRQEWEDLKQEIRSRVVRNFGRGAFNGHSTLRTYVHRIARNAAIDFSRLAYRRHEVGVDLPEPKLTGTALQAARLGILPNKELLERILGELSEGERVLLRLVFELHYSYQEVARELGIPEGTVKSRMSRCKDRVLRLREELEAMK